jgi:hypothetical protein
VREREKKGGRLGRAEEKEKAGSRQATRENERGKKKSGLGPIRNRERKINAFEFEFKI